MRNSVIDWRVRAYRAEGIAPFADGRLAEMRKPPGRSDVSEMHAASLRRRVHGINCRDQ